MFSSLTLLFEPVRLPEESYVLTWLVCSTFDVPEALNNCLFTSALPFPAWERFLHILMFFCPFWLPSTHICFGLGTAMCHEYCSLFLMKKLLFLLYKKKWKYTQYLPWKAHQCHRVLEELLLQLNFSANKPYASDQVLDCFPIHRIYSWLTGILGILIISSLWKTVGTVLQF